MVFLVKRVIYFIYYVYYSLYYYRSNVRFSGFVKLNPNTKFEGYNKIYQSVNICYSKVGLATYISYNTAIPHTQIGRFCSIGPRVQTILGNHPIAGFVSTHPCFYSKRKQAGFSFATETTFDEENFLDPLNKIANVIGNDVWIGSDVRLLSGIRIGDGAIVASGALVTKDIPPYEIWGGVPAKKISSRFDEETVAKLLDFKWWEKDFEFLKRNIHSFSDINSFKFND